MRTRRVAVADVQTECIMAKSMVGDVQMTADVFYGHDDDDYKLQESIRRGDVLLCSSGKYWVVCSVSRDRAWFNALPVAEVIEYNLTMNVFTKRPMINMGQRTATPSSSSKLATKFIYQRDDGTFATAGGDESIVALVRREHDVRCIEF